MLSLRPNNVRPLPSLIGDSQATVTSDTDRNSMMSEMGHLERLSSAAFSTGSSRMSAGYGSNTLTPELSIGSQMGMNVGGMASGFDSKVTLTKSAQLPQLMQLLQMLSARTVFYHDSFSAGSRHCLHKKGIYSLTNYRCVMSGLQCSPRQVMFMLCTPAGSHRHSLA